MTAKRRLLKGTDAFGEGAVTAGCQLFCGYPITPQSELTHYLATRLPQVGGIYLQSESETAAINMVYGAAGAGARVLTASSGPGISLMSEGLSYLAGAELPAVIINIMRGGPGLGNTRPSQSDYWQATKGGGHGDYRLITLAPWSVQENFDFTILAFELADKYRNPVMILADGILAQMMETVEVLEISRLNQTPFDKPWATTGTMGRRPKNIISSLHLPPEELEAHNQKLLNKYLAIEDCEARAECYGISEAEIVVVAFGIAARIATAAIALGSERGLKIGLFRPQTLWPFPARQLQEAVKHAKRILVLELNTGQMVYDVRYALGSSKAVDFYGRCGGMVFTPMEILGYILSGGSQGAVAYN
ncbi:MAG: 3-methyl-2-oxobutanoate dehydrogenase subunit VorB [Clostridia bacterium]|nr:3-methyl-2-oxobutanoate dehydrogenase subunit VorB [Clostridia bacterium]